MYRAINSTERILRLASVVLIAITTIYLTGMPAPSARAAYNNLYSFTGPITDGSEPVGALVQQPGVNVFYGTTRTGGKFGLGTVFMWNQTTSTETILHNFNGAGGSYPTCTLILGPPSTSGSRYLYGTTYNGGGFGSGTVWRMYTNGTGFVILHHFVNTPDGANPWAGVILSTTGFLYGTTVHGGAAALGTVFMLKPNGAGYAVIHNFTGNLIAGSPDGALPFARLFEVNAKQYVGTTAVGGGYLVTGAIGTLGTVYTIGPAGPPYAILHTFTGSPTDGANPTAELINVPTAGALFLHGTTVNGGLTGNGMVYRLLPNGAAYSDVYDFLGGPIDGSKSWGALVFANQALYGTTRSGGPFNDGVIYELNPFAGIPYPEIIKYQFAGLFGIPPDGSDPFDALVQSTVDGLLYGDTYSDGSNLDGILFNQTP